jgi:serine/threonine-protein kinase RsbW
MTLASACAAAIGTTMAERPTYSLSIPSDLSMLPTARNFVESVGQCCGLEPRLIRNLVLATAEAVSNIVRHAHRHVPAAKIQVLFQLGPECVVLSFLDEGEPFDISSVPHFNPSELRIGGRGVYLMRTLMDDLSCRPRGPDQPGNCLRMTKRLKADPSRSVG